MPLESERENETIGGQTIDLAQGWPTNRMETN